MADQYLSDTEWQLLPEGDASGSLTSPSVVQLDDHHRIFIRGTVGEEADSRDIYSFTAAQDGRVYVVFDEVKDPLVYLNIFDKTANSPLDRPIATTFGVRLETQYTSFSVVEGETYRIAALSSINSGTPYLLNVYTPFEPQDKSDALYYDNGYIRSVNETGDAGDELVGSSPLVLDRDGKVRVEGSTGFDGDTGDVYFFSPTATGDLKVDLRGLSQPLLLQLRTDSGVLLYSTINSNDSSGLNDPRDKTFSYEVVAGQSYTLSVLPILNTMSAYTLSIDAPSDGTSMILDDLDYVNGNPVPDAGDDQTTAFVVGLNGVSVKIEGSVGFERADSAPDTQRDLSDWYKITVQENKNQLTFNLSQLANGVKAYLVDESVPTELTSSDITTDVFEAGKELYLHLQADDAVADGSSYRVDISASVPATPDLWNGNPIVGNDAGNNKDIAVGVQPDINSAIALTGSVGLMPGDTTDWYEFRPEASGQVAIERDQGDYFVVLRDDQGGALALSDQLRAEETYFLQILDNALSSGGSVYKVTLRLPVTVPESGDDSIQVNGGNPVVIPDASNTATEPYAYTLQPSAQTIVAGEVGENDPADNYRLTLPEVGGTASLQLGSFAGTLQLDGNPFVLPEPLTFAFNGGESYLLGFLAGEESTDNNPYRFTITTDQPTRDTINGKSVVGLGDDAANQPLPEDSIPVVELGPDQVRVAGSVGYGQDGADYYKVMFPAVSGAFAVDLSESDGAIFTFSTTAEGVYNDLPTELEDLSYTSDSVYYLKITSPQNGIEYDFTLDADYVPPGSDVVTVGDTVVFAGDASNNFAGTDIGGLGMQRPEINVSGKVGSLDDVGDCFRFTAATTGNYRISADGGNQAEFQVFLYDSDRTFLGGIAPGDTDYADVDANSEYFLVIDPVLDAEANYQLRLMFFDPA